MRFNDIHDLRKWHIESEMLAGRNPPRIMSEKIIIESKLDLAVARIAELEKELAKGICFQCGAPLPTQDLKAALARIATLENQLESSKANECEAASLYEGMLKQVDELRAELAEARKDTARQTLNQITESKTI